MDTPLTVNDTNRPVEQLEQVMSTDSSYLPAMGRNWLLPLYDPMLWLLRIRTHHQELVFYASLRQGNRVLEIGCGTGNLALLIKHLHPGVQVTGIDPDPKALKRANRKARRRRLAIDLDHGFAQALPYPDASFDRVVSAFMLHHLDPAVKAAAVAEALRVLKPRGSLHIVDLGGSDAQPDGGGLAGGLGGHLQHRSKRLHDNLDGRIPELLRAAGFAHPTEAGQQRTIVGPVTHYQATAPARSDNCDSGDSTDQQIG